MDCQKLYKEIGQRIYKRRKELYMTQDELATKIGVSSQMISYAENGIKGIRPENIIKISSALQISCDYLLTGKYSNFETDYFYQLLEDVDLDAIDNMIELFNLIKRSKNNSSHSNSE